MRNFLAILNGVVVATIQATGDWDKTLYTGQYDTVTEDPSGTYKVGDAYNLATFMTKNYPPTAEQIAATAKQTRDTAVAAITVTVGTKVFDGDETSQTRMVRAITALQVANATSTKWKLHDNTIADVTISDLQQALVLAGQAQTQIWMA